MVDTKFCAVQAKIEDAAKAARGGRNERYAPGPGIGGKEEGGGTGR